MKPTKGPLRLLIGQGYEVPELLEIARAVAHVGGSPFIDRMKEVLEITVEGGLGNVVANIGVAAEVAVRGEIFSHRPVSIIIGEELADRTSNQSNIRWSADPLDGTTN